MLILEFVKKTIKIGVVTVTVKTIESVIILNLEDWQ